MSEPTIPATHMIAPPAIAMIPAILKSDEAIAKATVLPSSATPATSGAFAFENMAIPLVGAPRRHDERPTRGVALGQRRPCDIFGGHDAA